MATRVGVLSAFGDAELLLTPFVCTPFVDAVVLFFFLTVVVAIRGVLGVRK